MKVLVVLVSVLIAGVMSETADKYRKMILKQHNDYRRDQKSSNINKLVWSDKLAREADAWVSRCDFKHQQAGRGENIAMNTSPNVEGNIKQAMEDWYNEIQQYNYAGKSCAPMSCHYTQMVWCKTREVGCAMKRCPSLNMFGRPVKNAWFFGCWYDPAGNNMSEYPYLKGPACSQCAAGQRCEEGLCAGGR